MRRSPIFLWLLVASLLFGVLVLSLYGSSTFTSTITVTKERTPSTGQIDTYELRFPDGSAVTVMGSRSVPLIQHLHSTTTPLTLTLSPRELKGLER